MNRQLLLLIQREIFQYTTTFINADDIPPPYELLKLKEITREALQYLNKIEKRDQKPSLGRLEHIMEELVILKAKRLIPDPHFETMFSSLINRVDEYRYLVTCSLYISVYGTL